MSGLFKEQENIFERMKKSIRNFKKDSASRKTKSYLETRIHLLTNLWDEFNYNHKGILKLDSTETESYFKIDLYDQVEELYVAGITEIKDYLFTTYPEISVPQSRNTDPSLSHTDRRSEEKLPTIKLPIFTGKYEDWVSFRDLFSCLINDNESLSDVQRLYYLKTHVGGEAEHLIKHYQITESNFANAWDALRERFENKRIQVNSELKILLSQPKITIESSHNVKTLVDTSDRCVKSLSNLGISVDKWDAILVYTLSQKLAHETTRIFRQTGPSILVTPHWLKTDTWFCAFLVQDNL